MNILAIMDHFLTFLLRHHETSRSVGGEFRWGKHVSAVKTESHYALLRGTKFPLCLLRVPLLELLYHPKDSERLTDSRATGCFVVPALTSVHRVVNAKLYQAREPYIWNMPRNFISALTLNSWTLTFLDFTPPLCSEHAHLRSGSRNEDLFNVKSMGYVIVTFLLERVEPIIDNVWFTDLVSPRSYCHIDRIGWRLPTWVRSVVGITLKDEKFIHTYIHMLRFVISLLEEQWKCIYLIIQGVWNYWIRLGFGFQTGIFCLLLV